MKIIKKYCIEIWFSLKAYIKKYSVFCIQTFAFLLKKQNSPSFETKLSEKRYILDLGICGKRWILLDGSELGVHHRLIGPAVIYHSYDKHGTQQQVMLGPSYRWVKCGKCHRPDGPAAVYYQSKHWYYNNIPVYEETYWNM